MTTPTTTPATPTRWVYLADMGGSYARIAKLGDHDALPPLEELDYADWTTGSFRSICPAQVVDGAPIGLRRYILEQTGVNMWRETGEQLPLSDALYTLCAKAYYHINGWNFDYPHRATERSMSDEQLAALKDTLERSMAKYPYDFEIIGLQPRFLLYYTDGSVNTQKRFIDIAPQPGNSNPFDEQDQLKAKYVNHWSNLERDAGKPIPVHGTPLLYRGPAVVVRFRVDGQQPAFGHCRVYVEPDGKFICSDWCQRHDFSSYGGGGINLQTGIYDFDTWIIGPCLGRAAKQGVFTPKGGAIQTTQIRQLIRRGQVVTIPTLAEAMAAADKQLAKQQAQSADPQAELVQRVRATYKTGAALTPTERIDAVVAQVEADIAAQQVEHMGGVPFRVSPGLYVSSSALAYLKAPKLADGTYRLIARPRTCGANAWEPCNVCFRSDNGVGHVHPPVTALTLDVKELRAILPELIEREDEARKPVVEVGPITADILAEAKAIADAAFQERLAKERAQLLEQNIAKAEAMASNVDAKAVQPVEIIYDAYHGGPIRLVPGDNNTVCVTMPLVAQKKWNGVYRYAPEADLKVIGPKDGDTSPVANDSVIGTAVRWYFETFLPQQLAAKQAAQAKGATVTVHSDSFRCYPVVSGATLERVVDGAVSEAVTVRRKANGHIYRVTESGRATPLKDPSVKWAARKYFRSQAYYDATRPQAVGASEPGLASLVAQAL